MDRALNVGRGPQAGAETPLSRFCDAFLLWGIGIVSFLNIVMFYLRTYDSCQIKITIVQLGGTLLIAAWIVKLIEERRVSFTNGWAVCAPALAMLISGVISFALSPFKTTSWDDGLRRVLYVGAFFVTLDTLRTEERLRGFLRWIAAGAFLSIGYGVVQYIDTHFYPPPPSQEGVDPFIWRHAFGTRIFSTMGNPNFYGDFLDWSCPVLLMLYFVTRKYLYMALAVAAGLCAYWTGSKGAWIAYAAGVAAFAAMSLVFLTHKGGEADDKAGGPEGPPLREGVIGNRDWGIAGGLAALGIGLGIVRHWHGSIWALALGTCLAWLMIMLYRSLAARVGGGRAAVSCVAAFLVALVAVGVPIFSVKRPDSINFRTETWAGTLEMTMDPVNWYAWKGDGVANYTQPPLSRSVDYGLLTREQAAGLQATVQPAWLKLKTALLGNGIGTFKTIYPQYRRQRIFYIEAKHNTETDHSENEYLEVFYDEGIIGLGIYLWLAVAVYLLAFRRLDVEQEIQELRAQVGGKAMKKAFWSAGGGVGTRTYYLIGFTAGLFGTMTHNFVDVSMRFVSSGFAFWTLIGLIGSQIVTYVGAPAAVSGKTGPRSAPASAPELAGWVRPVEAGLAAVAAAACVIWVRLFLADVHHNIAIAYSKQGAWPEALSNYNAVIRFNPNYAMTHYFKGNVYNDRWDADERGFLKATYDPDSDPSGGRPRTDADRALEKYLDVKRLAPNYVQTHFQVANVYKKLAQQYDREGRKADSADMWRTSIEHYRRAIRLDPVFPRNYFEMAWAYVNLGQWTEAEAAFIAALKKKPEYSEAYVNLGNVYYMQKKYRQAEWAYTRAGQVEPGFANAFRNLAVLYLKTGRASQSLAAWTRVLQITPNDQQAKEMVTGLLQGRVPKIGGN